MHYDPPVIGPEQSTVSLPTLFTLRAGNLLQACERAVDTLQKLTTFKPVSAKNIFLLRRTFRRYLAVIEWERLPVQQRQAMRRHARGPHHRRGRADLMPPASVLSTRRKRGEV